MTIKTKFILTAGIIAVALVVAAITAVTTVRAIGPDGPSVVELRLDNELFADIVPPPMSGLEAFAQALHLMSDPGNRVAIEKKLGELRSAYDARAAHWQRTQPSRELDTALAAGRVFFDAVFRDLIPAVTEGPAKAVEVFEAKVEPAYHAEEAAIAALVAATEMRIKSHGETVAGLASTRPWIMIAVFAIALLLAAGASYLLARSVLRPMQAVRDAALRAAEGDTEQRIDYDRKDEIGEMIEAIRGTLDYMQGVTRAANALAAGDITARATPRSSRDQLSLGVNQASEAVGRLVAECKRLAAALEKGELSSRCGWSATGAYGEVVTGLNAMVTAVQTPIEEASDVLQRIASRDLVARMTGDYVGEFGTMRGAVNTAAQTIHDGLAQVAGAADEVAAAVTNIANSNQSVAAGSSQQAASLEETAASIEEMSVMTKQNAGNAREANSLVQSARDSSQQASSAMMQMTEAMEKIRTAAQATAAIISDINEIAFQTNLLALNAAVEGARAGEAGRGFAVVAEEVRNLALRSKEAARNTESLIRESMQLSDHGQDIARQVASSLGEIDGQVGRLTGIVGDISNASDEQARGIEHLNKAVSQIEMVMQRNVANAEESAGASEELSAQAREMASLVSTYRIERDGHGPSHGQGHTIARGSSPVLPAVTGGEVRPTRYARKGTQDLAAFDAVSGAPSSSGGSAGKGHARAKPLGDF